MMFQPTPLPPDVEYVIDCALEHDEIDGGSHITLKCFADRSELMRVIDAFDGRVLARDRRRMCADLMTLADARLSALPWNVRGAVAWGGALHMRHRVQELAEMMATWAIDDAIVGGCMEPFKRPRGRAEARRIEHYEPSPKTRRQLASPRWIKRYVSAQDDARQMRGIGTRLLHRLAAVRADTPPDDARHIVDHLQAQHDGFQASNRAAIRSWALREGLLTDGAARSHHRRARKVIKRAAALGERVIGRDQVSRFAHGLPVLLRGNAVDLEIVRRQSSATRGHSGVAVAVRDADSGHMLGDLCVYHEATPALDQVVALALGMQSGEEGDILATANLVSVTERGLAHPALAERGRAMIERHSAVGRRTHTNDRRSTALARYLADTMPMWTEATGVFVLGRAWAFATRAAGK